MVFFVFFSNNIIALLSILTTIYLQIFPFFSRLEEACLVNKYLQPCLKQVDTYLRSRTP